MVLAIDLALASSNAFNFASPLKIMLRRIMQPTIEIHHIV